MIFLRTPVPGSKVTFGGCKRQLICWVVNYFKILQMDKVKKKKSTIQMDKRAAMKAVRLYAKTVRSRFAVKRIVLFGLKKMTRVDSGKKYPDTGRLFMTKDKG
jgi:hypothetical protein